VTDKTDPDSQLTVWFTYSFNGGSESAPISMSSNGKGQFSGTLGPFDESDTPDAGGTFVITVHAHDLIGNQAGTMQTSASLFQCISPSPNPSSTVTS
jgi:hypothetical protein